MRTARILALPAAIVLGAMFLSTGAALADDSSSMPPPPTPPPPPTGNSTVPGPTAAGDDRSYTSSGPGQVGLYIQEARCILKPDGKEIARLNEVGYQAFFRSAQAAHDVRFFRPLLDLSVDTRTILGFVFVTPQVLYGDGQRRFDVAYQHYLGHETGYGVGTRITLTPRRLPERTAVGPSSPGADVEADLKALDEAHGREGLGGITRESLEKADRDLGRMADANCKDAAAIANYLRDDRASLIASFRHIDHVGDLTLGGLSASRLLTLGDLEKAPERARGIEVIVAAQGGGFDRVVGSGQAVGIAGGSVAWQNRVPHEERADHRCKKKKRADYYDEESASADEKEEEVDRGSGKTEDESRCKVVNWTWQIGIEGNAIQLDGTHGTIDLFVRRREPNYHLQYLLFAGVFDDHFFTGVRISRPIKL